MNSGGLEMQSVTAQTPYTRILVDDSAMSSGPMSAKMADEMVAIYQDINPKALVVAQRDEDTRWTATFERGSEWHIVDRDTFGTVAKVGNPDSIADRTDESNARLIAAAPRLYAEAAYALAYLEDLQRDNPLLGREMVIDGLRAAIRPVSA